MLLGWENMGWRRGVRIHWRSHSPFLGISPPREGAQTPDQTPLLSSTPFAEHILPKLPSHRQRRWCSGKEFWPWTSQRRHIINKYLDIAVILPINQKETKKPKRIKQRTGKGKSQLKPTHLINVKRCPTSLSDQQMQIKTKCDSLHTAGRSSLT